MQKISIIMSVYNNQNFLRQAIRSILNQSYTNFIFIVINDASTDKTKEIVESYQDKRILLINNKHRIGVAKCLNIALKYVKTDFIARMDADDISEPNRLKIQMKYLSRNKDVGIIGSAAKLINQNGKIIGSLIYSAKEEDIREKLITRNTIIHPTVMFRTKLIRKYGIYDEKINGAEDYDLWLRLAKKTKIVNLSDKLLKYRIHKDNVSNYAIKRVEKATIQAQIKALIQYKYNILIIIYIIRNLIFYFLPRKIKRFIYELFSTF